VIYLHGIFEKNLSNIHFLRLLVLQKKLMLLGIELQLLIKMISQNLSKTFRKIKYKQDLEQEIGPKQTEKMN
jgi:hypothetical protein